MTPATGTPTTSGTAGPWWRSPTRSKSKGDQDIAEWLPELGRCRYVREWVAVKTRWHLRVDQTEKRRLVALAGGCDNSVLRVRTAVVHRS